MTISGRGCGRAELGVVVVTRHDSATRTRRIVCASLDCRHERSILWADVDDRGQSSSCSPSAHVDTFCRDNLPPPDAWPELLLRPARAAVPGAAQLRRRAARRRRSTEHGAGPAVPARARRRDLDLRRAARTRPTRSRTCSSTSSGSCPGNRVLLRGAEQPVAGRLLVRGAQGRRRSSSPRCRCCAPASSPRSPRSPGIDLALCDPGSSTTWPPADPALRRWSTYGGAGRRRPRAARRGKPATFDDVDTAADDVALLAFTSGTTGRPKATMHFHRDVLAIADTFGRARAAGRRRTTSSPARPPLAFTFGLGGLRGLPAAGRRRDAADREGHAGRARRGRRTRTASRCCFTAPTAYRAMLRAGQRRAAARRCAARCRPASTCPQATWEAFHDATGIRLIDGIGSTEMLHIFISAADDDIRPGCDRPGRARLPARRSSTTTAARCPTGTPGRLAVKGPTGCRYLADAAAGRLRAERLEHHRRHLRPRRRRLLLVPGPQRRHDRLVRLQHRRRRRSRRRCSAPATSLECAVVGAPDEDRGQVVHGVRRAARRASPATRRRSPSCRTSSRRAIAPYKYPRSIEFVDALPRTSTGKLQRFRLRERAADDVTRSHAHRGHRRRARRPLLRRAGQAAATRRTRSRSGSATRPTTRSASVSCSPTRRSAASSTPTRRSTRGWQREFARWDDIDVHFRGRCSPAAATASRR